MFGGSSSLTVKTILYHFLPQDASFLPRILHLAQNKTRTERFPILCGFVSPLVSLRVSFYLLIKTD